MPRLGRSFPGQPSRWRRILFTAGLVVVTKVHTTDSLVRKESLRNHTTNSLLRKLGAISHTTDALLRKLVPLTHTADVLLRKVDLKTHTTNSLFRKVNTRAHTTDTLLRKTITRQHTTDSLLTRRGTKTHTTSSYTRFNPVTPDRTLISDSFDAGIGGWTASGSTVAQSSEQSFSGSFSAKFTASASTPTLQKILPADTDRYVYMRFRYYQAANPTLATVVSRLRNAAFGQVTGLKVDTSGNLVGKNADGTDSITIGNISSSAWHFIEHWYDPYTGKNYARLDNLEIKTWTNTSTGGWSKYQIGMVNSTTYTTYFDDVIVSYGETGLYFNGVDDMVSLGDYSDFSVPTTGALTIGAWIRPDVTTFPDTEGSGYVHWLSKVDSNDNEWVFRMYSDDNSEGRANRISFYVYSQDGLPQGDGVAFQDSIVVGDWIFVVGSINASGLMKMYKNGVFRNQFTTALPLTDTTTPVRIGSGAQNANPANRSYFKGGIDDITIWNRQLTDAEVLNAYKGIIPSSGLVARYRANESYGSSLNDMVGVRSATVNEARWIQNTAKLINLPLTHTTSAQLRKVTTKAHTTNALLRSSATRTHTTNTLLRKAQVISHATDSYIRAGQLKQHTTNALLRKVITKTHTTNALLRAIRQLTHTTNTLLRRVVGLTHTTNTLLRRATIRAHSADSLLRKLNTRAHTTNAILRAQNTRTHTTNASLLRRQTLAHTTNALLRKQILKTHTTNTLLRKVTTRLHSTDAFFKRVFTRAHTTGSLLRKTVALVHTTNSLLRGQFTRTHTTSASLTADRGINHSTNSLLRKVTIRSHTTNSLLAGRATLSHTTNSLLRRQVTKTHLTDTLLRKLNLLQHTTGALLKALLILTHTTNSLLRKVFTVSHGTDARASGVGRKTHTTSASLREKSFTKEKPRIVVSPRSAATTIVRPPVQPRMSPDKRYEPGSGTSEDGILVDDPVALVDDPEALAGRYVSPVRPRAVKFQRATMKANQPSPKIKGIKI